MRLWSLHPSILDRAALVACWREGLLAQKVLAGGTRGYTHHPQLTRFRAQPDPLDAIGAYLAGLRDEATARGYRFDATRILRDARPVGWEPRDGESDAGAGAGAGVDAGAGARAGAGAVGDTAVGSGTGTGARADAGGGTRAGRPRQTVPLIDVTAGQLDYELEHLRAKVTERDPDRLPELPPPGTTPTAHPLLRVVPGEVEDWEVR